MAARIGVRDRTLLHRRWHVDGATNWYTVYIKFRWKTSGTGRMSTAGSQKVPAVPVSARKRKGLHQIGWIP
ncbi:hypothetical protein RR42_s1358 [Cupriavidus basilensis]|uniref:Uncharacterized protein n=1 Tax=Cupriavidus basilensis TaxID=68895 RepID=A0A0C4YQT4_9BURK|nr:hypothetical protein RR42_s1358 [Cupriavidus basilensis]